MNFRQKRFFAFLLTCLVATLSFYYVGILCDSLTDGFSVARIHSELPFNPEWETSPLSEPAQQELDQALSQTYRYLGCGGQCFAFCSADGKYVVKFFKHRIRKPYSFFYAATLPFGLDHLRQRKLKKALFKHQRDFTSYKIAYEDLREETGLLYVHLNKGTSSNRSLQIIDKLGIGHRIALDQVEFVVQKKAQLVHDKIEDLMADRDPAKAKAALHGILDVIVSRCKKGIFDEDPRIHRNFGFLGETPIFIDVGRFIRDPRRKDPAVYQADIQLITKRFRHWLEEAHPELVTTLDEELYELHGQD
jgi:hypothetical protein